MNRLINPLLATPSAIFYLGHAFILALMLFGITQLELRNNDDSELPASDPIVTTNHKFEEIFGSKDRVLISLEAKDAFTPKILTITRELSNAFVGLEWVIGSEIKSLSTTKNITSSEYGLEVEPLYRDEIITPEQALIIKEKAQANPLIHGRIVSADGKSSLILINIAKGSNQALVYRDTYRLIEQYREFARVRVVGDLILSEAIDQGIEKDASMLIPLALLFQLLTMYFLFRNVVYVFASISTVALSIIWTMGLMGLLGYPITVVTTSIPIMVAVIVSSYVIHFIRAFHLSRQSSLNQSIKAGYHLIAKAIMAASITSAIGAFTLVLFKVTAIAEFGIITAIGTLVSAFLSITFLPFYLRTLMRRFSKPFDETMATEPEIKSLKKIETMLRYLINFSSTYPKRTLSVVFIIFVFGVFTTLTSLRFGANFADYLPDGHSVKVDMDYFDNELGGSRYFNIMLEASEENGAQTPEFLAKVDLIQQYAESLAYVGETLSFVDFVKRIDAVVENKSQGVIPDNIDQIAQYLLLYSISSSPDDFSELVDYEYKRVKIYIPVTTSEQEVHLALYQKIHAFIEQQIDGDEKFEMGGNLLVWIAQMDYIIEGKILNVIVSLFLIILLCSLFFKSLKKSLLAVMPVVFAIVCTFSLMALVGIRLEVSTAVITAITIGIGIDFSYHFIKGIGKNVQQGKTLNVAVSLATTGVGIAIVFDILSNVIGFSAFTFSTFTPITNFGYLIGFSMILSGFATFTIIPAFLALKNNNNTVDIQEDM